MERAGASRSVLTNHLGVPVGLASAKHRAEINGTVKYGEVNKGQRKIYVEGDEGEKREYSLPRGVHINVQEGERVKAGEPLMDGAAQPARHPGCAR